MKKLIAVILVLAMLFSLAACTNDGSVQSESDAITMYVGLGNGEAYYTALQKAIKENLGIDVKFIYQAAMDTTSATALEFKNNDLPADIVCTASQTNPDYTKNSCLDLMAYTNLAEKFTVQKLAEYTNDDGTVYQLPFTSKLIGITYNKTLMAENGWTLPQTYADMLELKQQCDAKGIPFAVSANFATGHGFNDLFHLMGANWISTLEGSNWIDGFLSGKTDVSAFKEKSKYFDQWVQNGLFGSIYSKDWDSKKEYFGRRALFFFDLTSSITSYQGEMTDASGNPTGVTLNDEYGSMPWISEDGTNNRYTYYDCMYMALNKNLAKSNQKDKLEKAVKILDFMTTDQATQIFTELNKDGYVALNSFNIDESRNYYTYKDLIEQGGIQPWYYSYFDMDTIVNTGGKINTYMRKEGSSMDEIMDTLQTSQTAYLKKESVPLTTFKSDLTYEETARLDGIGAILSLQNEYDTKGIKENVDASLTAYVSKLEDHQPFTALGTVSTCAYKGDFQEIDVQTIISTKAQKVTGIKMTGRQLKAIAEAGLKDQDVIYPYVLVSKIDIEDDKTYLVAVSTASLSEEELADFTAQNAMITDGKEAVVAPVQWGVTQFLKDKKNVRARDLTL